MADFNDFALRQKVNREKSQAKLQEQHKLRHQVSVVMSEVKGDPRWKVYADHILYRQELFSGRATMAKHALADPRTFLSQEAYGKLKLEAVYNEGMADGLKHSLDVIRDLIDRGKEPENTSLEEKAS